MSFTFDQLKPEYAQLWATMTCDLTVPSMVAKRLLTHMDRYRSVAAKTGIPPALIATLHVRESNADFTTYLGNGEPLNRPTRLVPVGRGPFATWEDGAVDALRYQGLDKWAPWTVEKIAFAAESFNGFGYRLYHSNIHTPYLWAGSNHYTSGKYTEKIGADGRPHSTFEPDLVDKQLGCMVVLKAMFLLDGTLAVPAGAPLPDVPAPDPVPPPRPPAALPAAPVQVAPATAAGTGVGAGALAAGLFGADPAHAFFIGIGVALVVGGVIYLISRR